jgi:hypothetical protein
MLCPQWAQTRYVVASVGFRRVKGSEGDMSVASLVLHGHDAVTLGQVEGLIKVYPTMGSGMSAWILQRRDTL